MLDDGGFPVITLSIERFLGGDATLLKGSFTQNNTHVITIKSPYCCALRLLFLKCIEMC